MKYCTDEIHSVPMGMSSCFCGKYQNVPHPEQDRVITPNPDGGHDGLLPAPTQTRNPSAAETGLSQIIAFLLERFSGGTITIRAAEWNAYRDSHVDGLLKTEFNEAEGTITLTSMLGEEAASTRLLLQVPTHGPTH